MPLNWGPREPGPPPGQPIGGYGRRKQAQRAVAFLVEGGIPANELTILSATSWGFGLVCGGVVSMLTVPVALVVAWYEPGGWLRQALWVLGALALGVLSGAIIAGGEYVQDRRVRRFLRAANPPVVGRYVVLCARNNAEKARDLLADPRAVDLPTS